MHRRAASIGVVEPGLDEKTNIPENRLMLAVLEDALVTFQNGLNSDVPKARRRLVEVERWIASDDTDWPFSFEGICTTLQIDSGYIRAGLRELKRMAVAEAKTPHLKTRREHIYDRRGWLGRIGK